MIIFRASVASHDALSTIMQRYEHEWSNSQ